MTQNEVHDNREAGRYELQTPQGLAFAEYRPAGPAVMFTHTEVPEALEGQGIGSRLVKAALDDVQAQGRKVIPMCPFVAAFIGQHPEYLELVDPAQRGALGM
ncbi:GNAT family N-acetyltransferase [Deinococcus aquiradiocola]|uniref:N-acetyltransferase n=1 Tax=Deinococcus aquiradiocola TaxID=393059 RepID=A0A917PM96_9DEIO|nr:GNAT family N-acetyltransferase [Deinococcus aquiradiocola]GGJ84472.1 N-acetyltransferase [Deinococcus aquiradiocola]